MASFSAESGADGDCRGGSLFVGSFNINSEDLTEQAARAWLKQAADADIVALGLQECAVVPANPFPEPTNGMAVARWQHAKTLVASDAEDTPDTEDTPHTPNETCRRSPKLADIAQAAITAALKFKGNDEGAGADAMLGKQDGDITPGASPGLDDSDDSVDGSRRALFRGRTGGNSKGMRQESYYLRGVVEAERDRDLLSVIANCLPGRMLVADVAMGETPTHGKIKVNLSSSPSSGSAMGEAFLNMEGSDGDGGDGGDAALDVSCTSTCSIIEDKSKSFKSVEWYGTIRLLVFVRKDLYKDLSVRTVVIPSGDKPSVVCDAPQDYAKDTSPDKGAVACYLRDPSTNLELLLVNCHLFGTNKYGVCEAVFDEYRRAQLKAIDVALKASLPSTAPARMVLLGDLNFRVEVLSDAKDKARGGNDFQAVVNVARKGGAEALLKLYKKSDRLRPLLEERKPPPPVGVSNGSLRPVTHTGDRIRESDYHTPEDEVPALLASLQDGLGAALARGEVVRPTFTYKPRDTSTTPRRYNDKRTPSWPDRILWRGFEDHDRIAHQFAAVRDVISSDHEPVYCLLAL